MAERGAVTKSQKGPSVERKVGECHQWKAIGQCSEGDSCSFLHDPATGNRCDQRHKEQTSCPHQKRRHKFKSKRREPFQNKRSNSVPKLPQEKCTDPSCNFWHPPVCVNCKSEDAHGDKCRFRHVAAQQKSKKSGVKGSRSLKILIRKGLFCGKNENWDQITPSKHPRTRGTSSTFGTERVHHDESLRSVNLMSAIRALPDSRGHKTQEAPTSTSPKEEFAENLEDTEVPAPAHISHDSDSERPTKVTPRKHSIETSPPKRSKLRSMLANQDDKGLLQKTHCETVPREEQFGDFTTADHKVLNEDVNLDTITGTQSLKRSCHKTKLLRRRKRVPNRCTRSCHKTKLLRRRERVHGSFSSSRQKFLGV